MKEKLSITLEGTIVKKLDGFVDGKEVKSRSHAIEKIIRERFEGNVTQALILCGGEGTRLRPITYEIPKPMIPINGKPLLEHIIGHLKSGGVTEVILAVGYKHEKIISHFGEKWEGVDIKYIIEKSPLGDGGCLHLAKDILNDSFFMLNGDVLSNVDIKDMVSFHNDAGCLSTIALTTVKDPKSYGVAIMKGNKITNFMEKPKDPPTRLINAGIYLFDKKVLEKLPSKKSFMMGELFPALANQGELAGYIYEGKWFDVGTPERYEMAVKGWK